ncbi:MAG TPA: helix-turn-helix domain-containing protein [Verrucomicrobiales bacterium]|jgi:AcrR family transcriptional regulator|nr:helix-turn-helix domain-containing protein [Verrucomicrobiales bacterium]
MNVHSVSGSVLRREREKQERRAAIMAAAEQVIVRQGFTEASIDGIAREAGLAAGTVYLYFPNKEALFQELWCNKVRLLNSAVAAQTKPDRPFAEGVRAVVRAMLLHFEEHRGFFEIFVRARMDMCRGVSQSKGVLQEIQAGTDHLTRWIRAAQRAKELAPGEPRLRAVALRGLVFQFTRDWLRSGCVGRLTKYAAFVTEFFMKGAA